MASTQVAFSKRFENIVKISRHLSEQGKESVVAKAEAQNIEEQFLQVSDTAEDYQKLCDDYVDVHNILVDAVSSGHDEEVTVDEEIFNKDGPSFGEYEWATFHADGVTSTIYKARSKDGRAIEAVVALKVINKEDLPPHNARRELRILQKTMHESIVPLLDSFRGSGSKLVLVFPFLRQDLENLLRTDTLTKKQAHMVMQGLFSALAHLHAQGIIHRDVKPSNILLRSVDGPMYLIDFGIAWSAEDCKGEPAHKKITDVGTTCYRPPELLFGCNDYDSSLDMWAAGCVVAEIARNKHYQVFDAGELGSELALIKSIFSTLGTPSVAIWPSAQRYQDWGKVKFQQFPARAWKDVLVGASAAAIDFVNKTVCYEPTQRLTAKQALDHPLLGI